MIQIGDRRMQNANRGRLVLRLASGLEPRSDAGQVPGVTDSSNGAVPGSMADGCAPGPEHDLSDRAILQVEVKLPVALGIEAQCRAQQLVDYSSVCHDNQLMSGVSFG